MSTITTALEAEVAAIRAIVHKSGANAPRGRSGAMIDRHFARILALISSRIRHFTKVYGLLAHADDSALACAIGVWRAIESYEPAKARFTTFVNWQLRGELQGLRYRLFRDVPVDRRPLSLEALTEAGVFGVAGLEDADALERTESLAAGTLARRACGTLLDEHFAYMRRMAVRQAERRITGAGRAGIRPGTVAPAELDRIDQRLRQEREIVAAHLLDDDETPSPCKLTAEQRRQIARRNLRALADTLQGDARIDGAAMATQH